MKALPKGKVFINILEFRQLPGADFGPHAHIPAIVYTVQGVSTISFPGMPSRAAGPGEAVFIPAQLVHTHENLDGRPGAAAIAAGLIGVVLVLCAATLLRRRARQATIAVTSISLIAIGALPLAGATADDYYLISVRPVAQRSLPMPRPDGRVAYTSPDVDPVPTGPYVETLSIITVPAGARYVAPVVAGPQFLAVLQGSASIQIGSGIQQVGSGDGILAEMGDPPSIANSGSATLQLLDFAVASSPGPPAAS
ncbi:MAG TPA: hypothetical protein VN834_01435 [Candidatus Acidoferrum sp.]|nr:hypothetical protein [Candidatus Acidoferrum sp.]